MGRETEILVWVIDYNMNQSATGNSSSNRIFVHLPLLYPLNVPMQYKRSSMSSRRNTEVFLAFEEPAPKIAVWCLWRRQLCGSCAMASSFWGEGTERWRRPAGRQTDQVWLLMMMWCCMGAILPNIILRGSHPAKALWQGTARPCTRLTNAAPAPRYLKSSVLSIAPEPRYLKSSA